MSKRNQSSSSKIKPAAAPAAARFGKGDGKAPMTGVAGGINLDVVRALAQMAGEYNLSEVQADPSGRIRVRRQMGGSGGEIRPLLAPPALSLAPPASAEAEPGTLVTSPFVGTFYRAPSPEAPVFVEVGQSVRKGQVVCIVEAMKLMNEIESESDGRVAEILVQNGEHVEYGQPLIRLVTVKG